VITELGVFEPSGHGFRVIELAPDCHTQRAEDANRCTH
jgi:acyl CoA:acetate/3-ketoacid CoA transferase beta subunit